MEKITRVSTEKISVHYLRNSRMWYLHHNDEGFRTDNYSEVHNYIFNWTTLETEAIDTILEAVLNNEISTITFVAIPYGDQS